MRIRSVLAVVFRDAREGVDRAVLAGGDGVDVVGALAIREEDGAVIGVAAGGDVPGDEVETFTALDSPLAVSPAFHAAAIFVDGAAGEVVDGPRRRRG